METQTTDKRFKFIETFVLRTLKLRNDRWQKCVAVEEQRQLIQEFLDKPENTRLIVYLSGAGQLVPTDEFVESLKNNAVFFFKKRQTAVSKDTIKKDLLYGNVSALVLKQFLKIMKEVSKVFKTLIVQALIIEQT